uniref:BPTI/Kunitz inhibitor domain-containing protein n=1 Tax=Glossina brevipalpis TaxID=37001 RepID=A0A1A9W4Q6_9MUSC
MSSLTENLTRVQLFLYCCWLWLPILLTTSSSLIYVSAVPAATNTHLLTPSASGSSITLSIANTQSDNTNNNNNNNMNMNNVNNVNANTQLNTGLNPITGLINTNTLTGANTNTGVGAVGVVGVPVVVGLNLTNNNAIGLATVNTGTNIDLLGIMNGTVVSGGSSGNIVALPKEKIYEKCTGPADPGPCKQYTYKWRYEPTTNECSSYIWGGCDGNPQNRFNSEAECLFHCIGAPHTLPPFLQTTTHEPSTTDASQAMLPFSLSPTFGDLDTSPIPFEKRGPELTFAETGQEKTFVFAQNNTFIQIDGDIIQTFQLRLCREISFQFRTRLPHGLLVYHNVKNPDRINLNPYALYVIVEKGQLKVVHVFGKHSTSVTVGEVYVYVRIDVHGARLIARVDSNQEEVYLKGLNHDTNYGVSTNLPSVVLVGGLSSEEKLHGVKYIIESFVGCIRNVVLSSGKAASDLLPITPLVATKHENLLRNSKNFLLKFAFDKLITQINVPRLFRSTMSRKNSYMPIDPQSTKKLLTDHKKSLKQAQSRVDLRPVPLMTTTFLRIDQLRLDYQASKRIMNDNIALLTKINKIQRNHGFTDNYRISKDIYPTNYVRSCQRLQRIEHENFMLGCRLLTVKSSINTRFAGSQSQLRRKKQKYAVPYYVMDRYRDIVDKTEIAMLDQLLRPKIFIDLYVKNIRPLGRLSIQLFTEACPEMILEFVRICSRGESNAWKIIRIFPILWLEGELTAENTILTTPGFEHEYNCIDHGQGPGILSFAQNYLEGFPPGLINFSISFKELTTLNGQRIPFGIVVSGLKLLDIIQDYGTKNGKTKKDIVIYGSRADEADVYAYTVYNNSENGYIIFQHRAHSIVKSRISQHFHV